MEEESIFRQMATVIKTSNGDRKIPVVTSKGEAVWMDEEQQYSLSDDTFGQASLSAYKLGTAINISEERLNDSVFDLPSFIAKYFARRICSKDVYFYNLDLLKVCDLALNVMDRVLSSTLSDGRPLKYGLEQSVCKD